MNRSINGFKLYQKGNVKLLLESEEELQFEVKSGKTDYIVSIMEDSIRCIECEDWTYRFGEIAALRASFLCKHCYAALFKLAEIKGVGEQGKLMIVQRINKNKIELIDHLGREWKTGNGKPIIVNNQEIVPVKREGAEE